MGRYGDSIKYLCDSHCFRVFTLITSAKFRPRSRFQKHYYLVTNESAVSRLYSEMTLLKRKNRGNREELTSSVVLGLSTGSLVVGRLPITAWGREFKSSRTPMGLFIINIFVSLARAWNGEENIVRKPVTRKYYKLWIWATFYV